MIPGGVYAGNPDDVPTFGTRVLLVTSVRQSEERTYAVVRAVFENFADSLRLHPALFTLKINDMVPDSTVVPLHPGATRYYREAGWLANRFVETLSSLVAGPNEERLEKGCPFSGRLHDSRVWR